MTLHAISPEAMTSYSDRLTAWFSEGDAFREIWRKDGMALMEMHDGQPVPTAKVHFGYTDGITTPTIRGGPETYLPIISSRASHGSSSCGKMLRTTMYPSREQLGLNGSFAVFKQVETDVVGFENFLQSNKDTIDPELLAARSAGDGATAFPSRSHPRRIPPPEESRPKG